MTRSLPILAVLVLFLTACAGEDENIVNPPPGNANVVVRLFNMVPDGKVRKLVMESGYQTLPIGSGGFTAPVQAPSDSSFLEIYSGSKREFRSDVRARFIRQSVYNVYAVASHDAPTAFDTVVLSNANRSLTTQPVAQLRAVNLVPDSTASYEIRIGCPNGPALSTAPVQFRAQTLYRELPPGFTVISISRIGPSGIDLIGTYECTLKEYTPYSIVLYPLESGTQPGLMLFEESDLTAGSERAFVPVQARDADLRVANLAGQTATIRMVRTDQVVASELPSDRIGSYVSVPTCESTEPDKIELTLGDGRSTIDSTSLTVRGRYTLIAAEDSAGQAALVIVPPQPPTFGIGGKATLRIASASRFAGGLTVSIGGRTDPGASNGLSAGRTIASNIRFDRVSEVSVIDPGEVPITVSTSSTPSTLLAIRRMDLQPNTAYVLLLSDAPDGSVRMFLITEADAPEVLEETEHAAFVRFVNGAPQTDFATVSVGTVIENARIAYRNSVATNLPFGNTTITANSARHELSTQEGQRSVVVATVRNGTETLFDITGEPLTPDPRFSKRRVINATGDVNLVSVSYDENFDDDPDDPSMPHVARQVPFGETSPIHTLDREVRGSMYVYDYEARKLMYTLPIDLGPLGNSYSLIVVGTAAKGYEVIVLQEF